MVCDDDRDLLYLYQQALGPNYSILAVDSGIECITKYIDEKAKGNKVNVLLLDYKLPDLPGDIVATTIRDLNGRIRTIKADLHRFANKDNRKRYYCLKKCLCHYHYGDTKYKTTITKKS